MFKNMISIFVLTGVLLDHSLAANDTAITTTAPDKPEPTTEHRPTTPTTTEKITTSTTVKPDTTTTTLAPDTTTTSKPTTTTSVPPTTPVPPPPAPKVFPQNIGNWSVFDSTANVACILMRSALQLSFPYKVDNAVSIDSL